MAALSFINQLELEDQVDSATSKEQGFVSGGSVASFTSKLSSVHRSDVLNSTLLAQLAAGKDHNWTTQTTEWYKKYVHVLGKIGWVVQDFEFEKYEEDSQTLQVSNAIIDIVKDILSPAEIQGVKRVLEALHSPQNELRWNVFDKKSTGPNNNRNFQVLPCYEDVSGQVVIVLGSFYFTATSREDRWLLFQYNSADVHLFKVTQVATLNEVTFSTVREAIVKKLGNDATTFTGELQIWNLQGVTV